MDNSRSFRHAESSLNLVDKYVNRVETLGLLDRIANCPCSVSESWESIFDVSCRFAGDGAMMHFLQNLIIISEKELVKILLTLLVQN